MQIINAVGDACPLPVIKTKKALEAMESGTLEVLVDNNIAVENLKRLAMSGGCGFDFKQEGDTFRVAIEKTESAGSAEAEAVALPEGKTVVVLSADTMGRGDDELGRILMKGFVFALTQLDTLPDTILLYNGGAKLSVEGSPALEDLIALEKAGAQIFTCGTCLNHFGLAEKLGVGGVTNMYAIAETLRDAGRVIRP